MKNERQKKIRNSRPIRLGKLQIGGGAPITVQSMTKTDTRDARATIEQIHELAGAGCDIVRVAVPDEGAAAQLAAIKKASTIPLIADIHFNYRLALQACRAGVDGLRINPGNIGDPERIKAVVREAGQRAIPIRIGVNSGSLEKDLLQKYGSPTAEALVESALRHAAILEGEGFDQIKISLKTSDVPSCIRAYRLLAERVVYPLHLGITEAGTALSGTVKSAVGMGVLLADGIGDTIRVSLTAPPVEEVRVGLEILKSLHLRRGIEFISCPTCGRCQIDLTPIAQRVEKELGYIKKPLKIAVMGCVVNGPGEARQADVGIAGGQGEGLLFKYGEVVGKIPEAKLAAVLIKTVKEMVGDDR